MAKIRFDWKIGFSEIFAATALVIAIIGLFVPPSESWTMHMPSNLFLALAVWLLIAALVTGLVRLRSLEKWRDLPAHEDLVFVTRQILDGGPKDAQTRADLLKTLGEISAAFRNPNAGRTA